jgi:coenzyme F420-reducing hydrogenase alpha subunit
MVEKKSVVRERAESYMARIEGHGGLDVDWRRNSVKLVIHEGERLFEGILVGKTLDEMHWITPRICGVCPIAHNLASLGAGESALGIKPSRRTKLLRRLMQTAQNVQSHTLHAVFLALPDYIGLDRITELDRRDPERLKAGLALKAMGDEMARVVAGRNVHPTRTTIGGFRIVPTPTELKALRKAIKGVMGAGIELADFFSNLSYPAFKVDLEFLALDKDRVRSSKRPGFLVNAYKANIEEEVRQSSSAKFGTYGGTSYMVGSLARLFFMGQKKTSPELQRLIKKLDFQNPFHNNLAQAIEIVGELSSALVVIDELLDIGAGPAVTKIMGDGKNKGRKILKGIGAIEAPRGGLYNEVHLGPDGRIKYANIITPTVQNLSSMEYTATKLLEQYAGESKKRRKKLLEMLVRAYDPCITCSAH